MKKVFLALIIWLVVVPTCRALVANIAISEMISLADNIFIGTAGAPQYLRNDKGMPLTRITFSDVLHSSKSTGDESVVFAGGKAGDTVMELSHAPVFERGVRYLIVALDNKKGTFNPLVGQYAYLKIINESGGGGKKYLITPQGNSLTIENGRFECSGARIKSVEHDGSIIYTAPSKSYAFSQLPQSNSRDIFCTPLAGNPILKTLSLDTALQLLEHFGVRFDKQGIAALMPAQDSIIDKTAGQTVFYCGYQNLKINMTPLPASFTPWTTLCNDAMWTWNQYMDLFRVFNPSGIYGHNGISEFGGFPTSANLVSVYGNGFAWGSGALAVTIYFWTGQCGNISEADIFANPSSSFTDNIWQQVNGSSTMYRATILHELGHVWGMMDGSQEQYNYDVPTAMHGAANVYEDGWGIHCVDAELIRRDYQNQTSIINNPDVGVESYYAQGGLHNAQVLGTSFTSGNILGINGLTVENIGHQDLSNVQVHFSFSQDNFINSFDYQSPTYYYWNSFPAERFSSGNYQIAVPYNIPSGYYYVGATVTFNGLQLDNFIGNNTTVVPQPVYIQGIDNVSVSGPKAEVPLLVVPDAIANQYLIKCKDEFGKIVVQDLTGRIVLQQDLTNKTIVLDDAYGLYLVHIQTPTRKYIAKLEHQSRL